MGNESAVSYSVFRQIGLVGCDPLFVDSQPFSADAGNLQKLDWHCRVELAR